MAPHLLQVLNTEPPTPYVEESNGSSTCILTISCVGTFSFIIGAYVGLLIWMGERSDYPSVPTTPNDTVTLGCAPVEQHIAGNTTEGEH